MSRRKAEDLIRAGRVTIAGKTAVLGDRAEPGSVPIAIDGIPLPIKPGLVYLLLNKPPGVISAASDDRGRPTVVSLVGAGTRVYPVGRLDVDSEGLIILTNDGTLADLITHPRNQVSKTYLAMVAGHPGPAALRRLTAGVELDDGIARAVSARLQSTASSAALVEVVMTEGRKREVRRMLDAVGHPVRRLVRTAVGPLQDQQLQPGRWRALEIAEVRLLYSAAGATWEDDPRLVKEEQ